MRSLDEIQRSDESPLKPSAPVNPDGAALIAAERTRQIKEEGWSPQHDDQHKGAELVKAAICYAMAGVYPEGTQAADRILSHTIKHWWPQELAQKWWKPKDRMRNLIRAGALIAAEIDRLARESAS